MEKHIQDLINRLNGEVANLMAIAENELGSSYLGVEEGSETDEAAAELYEAIKSLESAVSNLEDVIEMA